MNTHKWFKKSEMVCSHCGIENMSHEFMRRLDFIRETYGKPMVVTSGYRCDVHDRAIGGKGNHPTGEAADILVNKGEDMWDFVSACIAANIPRIVLYKSKPHVHIDIVPNRPKGVFIS